MLSCNLGKRTAPAVDGVADQSAGDTARRRRDCRCRHFIVGSDDCAENRAKANAYSNTGVPAAVRTGIGIGECAFKDIGSLCPEAPSLLLL